MSYKTMARRLVELEQQHEADDLRWLESRTDAEIEAMCADDPPELTAAIQALSDVDLERARHGQLSEAEILRMYEVRHA